MNDIKKFFERNVNEAKLLKLNKTKFMESFLKGSDYEEDYTYLRDELPEFLPKLQVSDSWIDNKKIKRIVKNNYFLITTIMNPSQGEIILGEIKFDENGKVLFARYSPDGLFRRIDGLIVNGKELLRGTIPDSEYLYPIRGTKFNHDFMIANDLDELFEIEYTPYNLKVCLKGKSKQISLTVKYDESGTSDIFLGIKEYKDWVEKFFPNSYDSLMKYSKYNIDDSRISGYKTDILKVESIHKKLQDNNFKENELSSYLEMYNLFIKFKNI